MNIIHDMDGGPDDYIALFYLFGNASNVNVIGITIPSTGEVHGVDGAKNVAAVCHVYGKSDIPIAYEPEMPLDSFGKPYPEFLRTMMDNILVDKGIPPHPNPTITDSPVDLIKQLLDNSNERTIILATGPLTNIAKFIKKFPSDCHKIEKIVLMGGAVNAAGNIQGLDPESTNTVAEWNIYADPSSANIVFQSGIPIVMVPLDATNQVPMTMAFYNDLKNYQHIGLKLTYQLLKAILDQFGEDVFVNDFYLWDPLAAMIACNPDLAITERKRLLINHETAQVIHRPDDSGLMGWVDVCMTIKKPELILQQLITTIVHENISSLNPTILILTEDASNDSVQRIEQALKNQVSRGQTFFNIQVLEKKTGDGLLFDRNKKALVRKTSDFFPSMVINNIAQVLVRTWTNKREPVLALCDELKDRGLMVMDADLIPWTLSKIDQYMSLQSKHFFPKSVCVSGELNQNQIDGVLEDVEELGFPLVIKTSRGSRGTGVYRVNHHLDLRQFLSDYISDVIVTPPYIKKHGLLIQQFIAPLDTSSSHSTYLRINVVNEIICSVVQFELGWKLVESSGVSKPYYKLDDTILDAIDKPIDLDASLSTWYQSLLPCLPVPLGVVGIDIMQDKNGQYFLLEVNCSPIVSLIETLGTQYSMTASGKQCQQFSHQIAAFAVKQALKYQPHQVTESHLASTIMS